VRGVFKKNSKLKRGKDWKGDEKLGIEVRKSILEGGGCGRDFLIPKVIFGGKTGGEKNCRSSTIWKWWENSTGLRFSTF